MFSPANLSTFMVIGRKLGEMPISIMSKFWSIIDSSVMGSGPVGLGYRLGKPPSLTFQLKIQLTNKSLRVIIVSSKKNLSNKFSPPIYCVC